MTDIGDPQSAAEAISVEIGLDLSYFTDESESNLLPLALPIGFLLLSWFIEGLATGVGEATGGKIEFAVAKAVKSLTTRVKQLFGPHERTLKEDAARDREFAAETQAALAEAQPKVAVSSVDDVARVAEAYEQALYEYLTDTGMPGRDAVRIAQRVRTEAGVQLRFSPNTDPA